MSMPAAFRSRPSRTQTGWVLLAILLVGLALRLRGYTESVWIDELFTSNFFCGHPLVLARTLYSDIHPPAYFVFIHFWNQIFGDGEVWLRLPPLLSGLASLLVIYRLGESYRDRSTGLVAAALLALSPVHIWYSQEARPYSANLLLLLLTVYAYRQRNTDPRARWTWLFALGLTGIVFTHYYTAAYLAVFPLLAILDGDLRKRGVMLVSGAVGLALGAYMGVKVYFSHVPMAKSYLRGLDLGEAWELGFDWFLTGKSFTPRLVEEPAGATLLPLLQVLALLACLRGAWRLVNDGERRGYHLIVYLFVLPACLFGMYLVGLENTYIERSALPALPFFLLILASGLTGWRHPATRVAVLVTTAAACALILVFAHLHARDWTVYKANPDWKSAALFLGTQMQPDGEPLELYCAGQSSSPLTYYDPRIQEVKYFERNGDKIETLLQSTRDTFGESGFPGEWIQSWLTEQLAELDEQAARLQVGVRVEVRTLWECNPLREPDRTAPQRFWLLQPVGSEREAQKVLASRRTELISRHEFSDLIFYELSLAPRREPLRAARRTAVHKKP